MKRIIYFLSGLYLAGVLFTSCKKDIASPINNIAPTNFNQAFNEFWNQMNVNYVYWDIDTTNWDSMYIRYQPVFSRLNINNNADLKKSVEYFRQMTDGLVDNHYNLSFFPNAIVDSSVNPALDRKFASGTYRARYSFIPLDTTHYLDNGFISGSYSNSTGSVVAACGTIHHKILYFTCSAFQLNQAYLSNTNNAVKNALQTFFDSVQNASSIKGIIIDVRDNLGGDVSDLSFLIGHLINTPLHFGYTRAKTGNGKFDYSPWINAYVTPQTGGKALNIPVIVLADYFSASMAEATTMAIHALPTGIFVGEKTWGATGPLSENSLYDDGQFTIPGFSFTYTSSVAFKYIDGNIYEGKGFPPDINVPFNHTAVISGDDPQLDTAINLVH
jgi:carboxyl-terminal processing protease